MEIQRWSCPSCDDERDFVQPPCTDGHTVDGADCPDWACLDCGHAVFLGGWSAGAPWPVGEFAAAA